MSLIVVKSASDLPRSARPELLRAVWDRFIAGRNVTLMFHPTPYPMSLVAGVLRLDIGGLFGSYYMSDQTAWLTLHDIAHVVECTDEEVDLPNVGLLPPNDPQAALMPRAIREHAIFAAHCRVIRDLCPAAMRYSDIEYQAGIIHNVIRPQDGSGLGRFTKVFKKMVEDDRNALEVFEREWHRKLALIASKKDEQ